MSTFAKGVTSGYSPMGGVIVNEKVSAGLRSGAHTFEHGSSFGGPSVNSLPMFMHGSTFGGHPAKRRSAMENMGIERAKLLENVHNLEGHFEGELNRMAADHPIVKEVRGMGFFWAVEVKPERADGTPLEDDEYQKYFKGVVSRKLLEGGLICRFDDKDDPVIQYSGARLADREVLSRIAEITDVPSRSSRNSSATEARRKDVGPTHPGAFALWIKITVLTASGWRRPGRISHRGPCYRVLRSRRGHTRRGVHGPLDGVLSAAARAFFVRVVVLEAEIAGFGASGRNGAWCSSGFPVSPEELQRRFGSEAARKLLLEMRSAVEEVGGI